MKRYFRSLWFRLIFGLFFGSFAAVLVASAFLYVRFKNVSSESRERTLQGQAKLIGHLFQAAGGRELVLPEFDGSLLRRWDREICSPFSG